jgi:hypothetical protein
MKPQDIIKAIAELDGWLDVKEYIYNYDYMGDNGELKQVQGRDPLDLGRLQTLKSYLTSRDAIVPVIEKHYPDKVAQELGKMLANQFKTANVTIAQIMCATPSQLCEALLRATGKWVD